VRLMQGGRGDRRPEGGWRRPERRA